MFTLPTVDGRLLLCSRILVNRALAIDNVTIIGQWLWLRTVSIIDDGRWILGEGDSLPLPRLVCGMFGRGGQDNSLNVDGRVQTNRANTRDYLAW